MKPHVSFITSLSAHGIDEAKKAIDETSVKYVDVYAFMQKDVRRLWPESRVGNGKPKNALFEMAAALEHPQDYHRVALALQESVSPCQIAGFATYLPEITSHNGTARKAARDALSFLVNLTAILRKDYGHPISTIELVGGNNANGLWRGKLKAGPETFVLNKKSQSESFDLLFEGLKEVAVIAVKQPVPVRLAIELEPGPLFNVHSSECLFNICNRIEAAGPPVSNVVGLNLDIPHWCFLASIDATWVAQHPTILKRVLHAHVCDHSTGHFSDAEMLLFHGATDFAPWLRLLSNLPLCGDANVEGSLGYSGFLSCELECCFTPDYVKRSHRSLRDLVDRCC
jgi:sugar phosphate isomerase/epimerase